MTVSFSSPPSGYIPVSEAAALVVDETHPLHGNLARILSHDSWDSCKYELQFADGSIETVSDSENSPVRIYSRFIGDARLTQPNADRAALQRDYLAANKEKTPADFNKSLVDLFSSTPDIKT